jgi:hypothetical protein
VLLVVPSCVRKVSINLINKSRTPSYKSPLHVSVLISLQSQLLRDDLVTRIKLLYFSIVLRLWQLQVLCSYIRSGRVGVIKGINRKELGK